MKGQGAITKTIDYEKVDVDQQFTQWRPSKCIGTHDIQIESIHKDGLVIMWVNIHDIMVNAKAKTIAGWRH